MSPSETPDQYSKLFEHKDEILASKRIFDICKTEKHRSCPEGTLALERIMVGNFIYLTTNDRMNPEEYYTLLEKCEKKGDFSDLAIITYDFIAKRTKEFLEANPNLPESGDALHPGKGNLRGAIRWNEERVKNIGKFKKEGNKLGLSQIGIPALREIPRWILLIKKYKISMSEVYKLLEKGQKEQPAENTAITAHLDKITQQTRKSLKN